MDECQLYNSLQQFVNDIALKNMEKPKRKFLTETLVGVITSGTLVVSDIARELCSQKNLLTIYKRINRNLIQYSLLEIQEKSSEKYIKELGSSDIMAIDMGDITKPYAEIIEYLGKVADGSDGHRIKNGYWLLGAASINIKSKKRRLPQLVLSYFHRTNISIKAKIRR